MTKINTKLDISKVPELVGEEPNKLLKKCYRVLENTQWPLYITGPSGSGKSIMAFNLAKQYSEDYNVPAYYVQLSPEQTKTSLILGLRLVKGSLEVVNGVVADCMEQGGIIIIDEATHSTQELLLMFNSILDRTSITSVGDKTIISDENFRIIFCANNSTYAGNIKLPQSFAQRLVGFYFDYPKFDDEIEIVKQIADDECLREVRVPEEVIRYIVSLMREVRTETFPLSVRNSAIATVMLQLAQKQKIKEMLPYFTQGSNVESIRRNIASRIFNKEIQGVDMLNSDEVNRFARYISKVGIEEFKEIVMQSFMSYLDIDCGFYDLNQTREVLIKKII